MKRRAVLQKGGRENRRQSRILLYMKMKRMKCFALLTAAVLLLSFAGCGGGAVTDYGTEADRKPAMGEASDVEWSFDAQTGFFQVRDSRNGKTWNSGMTDEYYGIPLDSDTQSANKLCLFSVTYADEENNILVSYSNDDTVLATYSQDGERVVADIEIDGTGLSFQVDFALTGNTLIATVPAASVREEDAYKLVTLEMLPYFGASVSSEDGYIFYPDGSGALYPFKNRNESDSSVAYKRQIYCDYFTAYEAFLRDEEAGIEAVMLPVFGVKQGEGALLGNVTKGSAETTLSLYPFGYVYEAARICPTFNFRFLYELEATSGGKMIVPTKERSEADFQVQYTFLSGEDANYSGMARTYRQFLLDNGLLNKSEKQISVSVDYLLSLKKPVLLWEESVAASTFEDGLKTLQKLSEQKSGSVFLNLMGWQDSGYAMYPSSFSAAGVCGGKSGLQKLIRGGKELGMTVQLQENFFLALNSRSGEYSRDDLASALDNSTYIDLDESNLLMDIRSAKSRFENAFLNKIADYDATAVSLDDAGHLLYANGANKNTLTRTQALLTLEQMLKTAAGELDTVTVSGANAYVLAYADALCDIPQSSSGSFLFDSDVPFLQMVLHGYIPYTPEIPGNFSDDFEKTLLTWAEYGYVPYFSVSEESAVVLKDCYSNGVLVQQFDAIEDTILTAMKTLEPISALSDVAIYSHEKAEDGLVTVTYTDGTRVLVNGTDKAIERDGQTVAAKSFLTVR